MYISEATSIYLSFSGDVISFLLERDMIEIIFIV